MKILVDINNSKAEIFIGSNDKQSYKECEEYKSAVEKYKSLGYKVCVYVGGQTPLVNDITSLLDNQGDFY